MTIDDEQSRSNFKQLLSYFLIERFLLCSPDPQKTRVSSWGMVEDMNAFEEVNWAKIIYDNICESFGKLKVVMHKQQQHYFHGCAHVFEAIVFKRIKPLEPKANPSFAYLPIESYKPKRDWKPLEILKASEDLKSTAKDSIIDINYVGFEHKTYREISRCGFLWLKRN
ncbi:hypothetical protein QL285_019321 [Trifolium repens]|nr:hypothetical protein QL285_019321 [Trifolium repens]